MLFDKKMSEEEFHHMASQKAKLCYATCKDSIEAFLDEMEMPPQPLDTKETLLQKRKQRRKDLFHQLFHQNREHGIYLGLHLLAKHAQESSQGQLILEKMEASFRKSLKEKVAFVQKNIKKLEFKKVIKALHKIMKNASLEMQKQEEVSEEEQEAAWEQIQKEHLPKYTQMGLVEEDFLFLRELALQLVQKQEYLDAFHCFCFLSQMDCLDFTSLIHLGYCALQCKESHAALGALSMASCIQSFRTEVHLYSAQAYLQLEDKQRAQVSLNIAKQCDEEFDNGQFKNDINKLQEFI